MLFDLRRFAEAEVEFGRAIADEPEFGLAYAMLAATHCRLGKFHAAREAIKRALLLDPQNSYCHYILAHISLGKGNLDAAKLAIQEALRLDPVCPRYFACRASIALAQEKLWEAKESAEEGLGIEPENVECLEHLIQALFALGLFDAAEKVVQDLLRIDPELAEAHRRKGWLDFRKGKMSHAIEALRFGASREPEYGDGMVLFEKVASPTKRRLLSPLNWIARVLHLPLLVQFVAMLAPTIAYTLLVFRWGETPFSAFLPGDFSLGSILVMGWAALTIGVFGLAYIQSAILFDAALSRPKQLGTATAYRRFEFWVLFGLGVVLVAWIFLFLVATPFLMPRIAGAVLVCLSALLGYRALRSYLVQMGNRLSPESGWLRKYLLGIGKFDIRVLLVCSVIAGVVSVLIWAEFDRKPSLPTGPSRTSGSPPPTLDVDRSTGEMIDSSGKRRKMGDALRRLYGVEADESAEGATQSPSTNESNVSPEHLERISELIRERRAKRGKTP
jgi:tetratricopeptide (TPR) repeat protein